MYTYIRAYIHTYIHTYIHSYIHTYTHLYTYIIHACIHVGKWEKLVDQNWKEVPPIDLLKITKLEGQPWLGLYALVG